MTAKRLVADLPELAAGSEPWFRERLRTLVEHPTVTPGRPDDARVRAGAEAAAEIIRDAGGRAELIETSGTPAVLGRFAHPQPRAKVVVYNHMDVQPADPAAWDQADPFAFEVEEHAEREFLYRGRGSTDDKGPALCALRAAALVAERELPIDIGFVWETEEEVGSTNFEEVVAQTRDALKCDGVIVSDTIWPNATQPAISIGLRGVLQFMLRLRTGEKQVHSGLAGGAARNPVRELCELVTAINRARFWKEDVLPPSREEIAGYAASGFDLEYFRSAHALDKLETEVPLEIMLRVWARPTFEVHGLVGGHHGAGVKTIVPDAAELKASFRLVAGQNPHRVEARLQQFVSAINPDVELDVKGYLSPYPGVDRGRVHEAITAGMAAAFGREPVPVREGGSIGAVPVLAEQLGVPVHFLPLSLPEHGYHAPNEYFDWRQARGGIQAFAHAFAVLADGP